MRSFSTENIDELARPDSAKIVDISEREMQSSTGTDRPEPGQSDGTSSNALMIVVLAVAVLVVVWCFVVKAKK